MAKINVNLNMQIETKDEYCGRCKFYNGWQRR